GDTFLIPTGGTPGSPSAFGRNITVNGGTVNVPTRAIVLTFTPANYATPQNVYLFAVNDSLPEGDRVVISAESVISRDATFDHATVRNVEVNVQETTSPASSRRSATRRTCPTTRASCSTALPRPAAARHVA